MQSYWNRNDRFQADLDRLWAKVVPKEGEADTFHGELLRAAGRLYYDRFNNGSWNYGLDHFRQMRRLLLSAGAVLAPTAQRLGVTNWRQTLRRFVRARGTQPLPLDCMDAVPDVVIAFAREWSDRAGTTAPPAVRS